VQPREVLVPKEGEAMAACGSKHETSFLSSPPAPMLAQARQRLKRAYRVETLPMAPRAPTPRLRARLAPRPSEGTASEMTSVMTTMTLQRPRTRRKPFLFEEDYTIVLGLAGYL
jgi:hypothetical protein